MAAAQGGLEEVARPVPVMGPVVAWPPAQHTTVPTTTPVGTGIPATRLTTMAATRNQARARSTTEPTAHSRARPAITTTTEASI